MTYLGKKSVLCPLRFLVSLSNILISSNNFLGFCQSLYCIFHFLATSYIPTEPKNLRSKCARSYLLWWHSKRRCLLKRTTSNAEGDEEKLVRGKVQKNVYAFFKILNEFWQKVFAFINSQDWNFVPQTWKIGPVLFSSVFFVFCWVWFGFRNTISVSSTKYCEWRCTLLLDNLDSWEGNEIMLNLDNLKLLVLIIKLMI